MQELYEFLQVSLCMLGFGYWAFWHLKKVKQAKKLYNQLDENQKKSSFVLSSGIQAYGSPITKPLWVFLISIFGILIFGILKKESYF
ncbi:hypothetical protein NBRC116188_29810 [Oceaniserpentilla sp. 4NH20-0058]|uniref:hypothetical protein n=1 Tax=Oceaniserpentilla sp. 4NH20-0058 TaxID=3127660 RepID=UPI0031095E40